MGREGLCNFCQSAFAWATNHLPNSTSFRPRGCADKYLLHILGRFLRSFSWQFARRHQIKLLIRSLSRRGKWLLPNCIRNKETNMRIELHSPHLLESWWIWCFSLLWYLFLFYFVLFYKCSDAHLLWGNGAYLELLLAHILKLFFNLLNKQDTDFVEMCFIIKSSLVIRWLDKPDKRVISYRFTAAWR